MIIHHTPQVAPFVNRLTSTTLSALLSCIFGPLVVLLAVQDPQDRQEKVDNIQIKADGSSNLFLDMIMPHNKLCVHQDVSREDQRSHNPIPKLNLRVIREERSHESKQYQHPEPTKQVWHPAREVILALAREQCQSEEDSHREYQRLKYNLALVEARDDGYGVGFKACEAC